MSTPSTTNTSLIFVTRRPAWEAGVRLKQAQKTDIFLSRSGLEQRQNRMSRSRWNMAYSVVLDREEAAARAIRGTAEIQSSLIIPFWTERGVTTSEIVADVVSTDRVSDADWFTAGEWIFLTDPDLGDQFRKILSVTGAALTLEADVDGLAYPTGTTVWPCRAAIRDSGAAQFTVPVEDSQTEPLSFTSL